MQSDENEIESFWLNDGVKIFDDPYVCVQQVSVSRYYKISNSGPSAFKS